MFVSISQPKSLKTKNAWDRHNNVLGLTDYWNLKSSHRGNWIFNGTAYSFRSKRSHTIRKINENCLWRYVFFLSLLKLQKFLNTNPTLKTIVLYVCGICTVELSVTLPFQTMSACCLTPNEQLLRVYVAMWTKNIRLNDDYVRFMY